MSDAGETPRAGRDLLCVALLLAASAALFAPAFRADVQFVTLSPAVVPPWRSDPPPGPPQDVAASDGLIWTWPNLHHWRASVRADWSGLLWNPRILCGSPFLATQDTFALYPSNLLSLAGDLPLFLLWTSLLHVALANVGAFLALRRLGLVRAACLAGAWAFGAGGWFLAHLDVVNFPQAAAWLPWIAFASDRAMVLGRTRDRLLLGLCVLLSILAGMVQITLISLLAAAIFARARAERVAREAGARAAARGVLSACAGVAIGLLLAGPQLVPLAEWSRDSSRVRAAGEDVRRFAFRPLEWTQLLVPEVLGSPAEISRWTHDRDGAGPGSARLAPTSEEAYPPARLAGARGPGATFLESACAPGAAALLLALLGIVRPSRPGLLFLGLAIGGALLAMDTPFLRALASVPGAAFGNPRRFLLLVAVGLAGLTAVGAHRFALDPRRSFVAMLPAAAVVAWGLLNRLWPAAVGRVLFEATADPASHGVPGLFAAQAVVPAIFFGAGAVLFAVRVPGAARGAGFGALMLADAFLFNARNNPVRPVEPIFPETALTRFLVDRVRDPLPPQPGIPVRYEDAVAPPCRVARFRSADPSVPAPIPPNVGMIFGLRDQQGYEGILPRRYEELLQAIQPGIVFEHHTVREWPDPSVFTRPCFDLLGARYVLSADHEVRNLFTLRQFQDEAVAVFGNEGFLRRVTVVTRARLFDEAGDLLAALTSQGFDPASEVLLLRTDAAPLGLPGADASGLVDLGPPAPGEEVTWKQETCASAVVEAVLTAPRLLVVTETYHRGWTAETQAGRPVPAAPANHAFQVYALPAGRTRVRVAFEPGSLRLGLGAAAFGLAALIADMILRRRRRHRVGPAHVP